MKVALIQMRPRLKALDANRERALALMASVPADLYVLPELFSSGYTFARADEVASAAEPAGAGPTFEALSAFARDSGAVVVYGYPERDGDRFYNAAGTLGPSGWIGNYRKIHLFAREKLFFTAGDQPAPVFDLPWGRLGVMICFDWYFPELTRSLALGGADLIAHPSNLVLPHCPQAMLTRSLENRVFTVTCNRVGRESNGGVHYRFIGRSQVVSPKGELLIRLSANREQAVAVDVDPAQARDKSVGEMNQLWHDRRPALYTQAGA